ncbi:MAG: hypothetical protein M0042_06940 [Nitrospiraceae bacterium]|nr:hypothetical protein [Nitrospiraceae bacterium]
MLRQIGKILIGIALLPFCIGFLWELGSTVFTVVYKPLIPYWFTGGALLYLVVHFLFRKPILSYVVGHELTHALFAVLFGGKVLAFQASEKGGHVQLTKSNVLITLAPYFFPLYTALALIAYAAAHVSGFPSLEPWLVLAAGASFAFHLVLTALFLRTDQKDIQEHGAFFSYPLIFLFNVLLTALLIRVLLARDMEFLSYLTGGIMRSLSISFRGFHMVYEFLAR